MEFGILEGMQWCMNVQQADGRKQEFLVKRERRFEAPEKGYIYNAKKFGICEEKGVTMRKLQGGAARKACVPVCNW